MKNSFVPQLGETAERTAAKTAVTTAAAADTSAAVLKRTVKHRWAKDMISKTTQLPPQTLVSKE